MLHHLVAFVSVVLLPLSVSAQTLTTGADLTGIVLDASGAVLPGANVTVINTETNATRSVMTDGEGRYRVAALQPGIYRVTVELTGFARETREALRLMIGQTAVTDFKLKLSSQSEALTVTATAPIVDPTRTAISTVINEEQIEQLPINGRNFISFSVITPAVTTDRTPQQGASATSGLSFGGQRARSNNIMVDGYDNNDPVVGAVRAVFSQEAVREFQVLTNSYSAEFGRASGGIVNIVTKSGTNRFHGNAFGYFRDDSLNAKDYFEKHDVFGNAIDLDKAPYSQSQWGGTLGGPIVRDRTFFFSSFEDLDVDANNLVTISPEASAVLNASGFPVQIGNVPYNGRFTQFLGKIDHEWSANQSMDVRFHISDVTNENIEPFGGLVAKSRGAVQDRTDWSLAASQVGLLGRSWLNEARAYYADTDQEITSLDPLCVGPCDDDFEGGPTLEVTGVASVGRQRFTPGARKNRSLQLVDTVTRYGTHHTVKAGFEYGLLDTKPNGASLPLHFGGRYIFAALPAVPALGIPAPLTSLQALALGLPAAYVQGYGDPYTEPTYHSIATFVQDDWRFANVTLKAGLRYQRQFWPSIDFSVPIQNGERLNYDHPHDGNDIAPRIAAAWDPAGNGRTSVHGAYGMFYDYQITSISGVPAILNGTDGVRTLVLRFPNSLAPWAAPGHRIAEPATAYPSLVFGIDPDMKTPYSHQLAVGVDHALTSTWSLSVNGVYFRGKNQIGTIDYNPVMPSLGTGRRPNDINGTAGTSASVLQYTTFGETWYKGMTVSSTKRFAASHQFMLSYTLSKAEDNSTDFQSAFIPEVNGTGRNPADQSGLPLGFNPESERGPATHDQRHRLVVSGVYRLPWTIYASGILTAASGRPFTPLAGFDWNGDGDGGAAPSDRARVTPVTVGPVGTPPVDSVRRNSETMKSQVTFDARVSKSFAVSRQTRVEGIFEVFNLFNRANFSEINNVFGGGSFPSQPATDALGRVTYGNYVQALPPRQIQLALKVTF